MTAVTVRSCRISEFRRITPPPHTGPLLNRASPSGRARANLLSLSLLWLMLLPGTALGVRPPAAEHPVPERMTIDEAVAYALQYNPELQAIRAQLGLAEAEVLSATLLANPSIGAAYI